MTKMRVEVFGYEELRNWYQDELDFAEPWKACKESVMVDMSKWLDYLIKDEMLFQGTQLCIPRIYMRDNLIKENLSGGLGGHFGVDKTVALVGEDYFWP